MLVNPPEEALPDYFKTGRSSPVSTLPRRLASANTTPSAGTAYGFRALAYEDLAADAARLAVGNAQFSGLTDFRIACWELDGTLRWASADLKASINGVNTNTLVTGLALGGTRNFEKGEEVFLGIATVGQSGGALRGTAMLSAIQALAPRLSATASGWTAAAAVPALASDGASVLPWLEVYDS